MCRSPSILQKGLRVSTVAAVCSGAGPSTVRTRCDEKLPSSGRAISGTAALELCVCLCLCVCLSNTEGMRTGGPRSAGKYEEAESSSSNPRASQL